MTFSTPHFEEQLRLKGEVRAAGTSCERMCNRRVHACMHVLCTCICDGCSFADFSFNFISDSPLRCIISFFEKVHTHTNNTKTYITMIHKTH